MLKGSDVRLIDSNNEQLGILSLEKAIELAAKEAKDLVVVAEQATPPVCRIMNFGKYVYEKNKRGRDQKKKQTRTSSKTKEIKFHANIDTHDYNIKLSHIKNFLSKGFKVKASLFFRGREMKNTDKGMDLMVRIGDDITEVGSVESTPRLIGRNIHMLLAPISHK